MMHLHHRTVVLPGQPSLPLHLVEAGPENAPLVVFLHGFPDSWHCWEAQLAYFSRSFRVVAPTQRGYDESGKPRGARSYCIDELAGDMRALLAHYGRRDAIFVGHDWGAAVAWHLALTTPEHVRRLAILNVPHPLVMRRFLKEDRAQRRRSSYIFFFQLPFLPEWWLTRADFKALVSTLKFGARRGSFSESDIARYKESWAKPGAMTGMLNWYRAALRHPPKRLENRGRVPVPTRIIWGEGDPFLGSAMAKASLELCDRGDLHLLPKARHWVQKDCPGEVNRLLAEFLAEDSGQE